MVGSSSLLADPCGKVSSFTSPFLKDVSKQLDAYLSGRLRAFNIPLDLSGTEFQRHIWNLLLDIPYGSTVTYSTIASRYGNPKAARAIAGACHANPVNIIVPCHRVIGANGSLTGYAGTLEVKNTLLTLESEGCYKNDI